MNKVKVNNDIYQDDTKQTTLMSGPGKRLSKNVWLEVI